MMMDFGGVFLGEGGGGGWVWEELREGQMANRERDVPKFSFTLVCRNQE